MLTIDEVLDVFPEATKSESDRHVEYYVHCRQFHKKGGRYKMSINAETGAYYCHDCGVKGNAITEFFDPAMVFLKSVAVSREEAKTEKKKREVDEWIDGIMSPGNIVPVHTLSDDHVAWEYLLDDRGLTKEQVKWSNLYYCDAPGNFKIGKKYDATGGRIIFPYYSCDKLVGWQAREISYTKNNIRYVWTGKKFDKRRMMPSLKWEDAVVPKYYTCPEMQRKRIIYNYDIAKEHNKDEVILVEGPIDCIKAGKGSVATMGNKITYEQRKIITTIWNTIYWILDPGVKIDDKSFFDCLIDMQNSSNVYYTFMDNGKDPGASTPQEIQNQINKIKRNIQT